MEKRMPQRPELVVYVSDAGYVCIKQDDNREESIVILEPTQVPTVISWLQECVDELQSLINTDEDDVRGPLSELWLRYLGETHGESWLQWLLREKPASSDADVSEVFRHVSVTVSEEAKRIILEAAGEKYRWDCENDGKPVSQIDIPEEHSSILARLLSGVTLSVLSYSYDFSSLSPGDAGSVAVAMMNLASVMEATFSLDEYRDRLHMLIVLADGRCGPYKADFRDRMLFSSLLANSLREQRHVDNDEELEDEAGGEQRIN